MAEEELLLEEEWEDMELLLEEEWEDMELLLEEELDDLELLLVEDPVHQLSHSALSVDFRTLGGQVNCD